MKILSNELHNFPRSRAALSLLAFCYYNMQDFGNAVQMYESLCKYFPEVATARRNPVSASGANASTLLGLAQVQEYKIYHAQSLYKAGMWEPVKPPIWRLHFDPASPGNPCPHRTLAVAPGTQRRRVRASQSTTSNGRSAS